MYKYFLKFGEKKYLSDLIKGGLYCSCAQKYWEIEEKGLKGQGDVLEASGLIHSRQMILEDKLSGEHCTLEVPLASVIHFDPLKRIPVYCVTAIKESECTDDGKIRFDYNRWKQVRQHFPKADSVVIIKNPEQFIRDISRSMNGKFRHKKIEYFKIIDGIEAPDGTKTMDMHYLEYLIRGIEPICGDALFNSDNVKKINSKLYAVTVNDAIRTLFCKDVYFECEGEYRFVFFEESVEEGVVYQCNLSEELDMINIDDFYNEYCV